VIVFVQSSCPSFAIALFEKDEHDSYPICMCRSLIVSRARFHRICLDSPFIDFNTANVDVEQIEDPIGLKRLPSHEQHARTCTETFGDARVGTCSIEGTLIMCEREREHRDLDSAK
jgi:hypothetical protein